MRRIEEMAYARLASSLRLCPRPDKVTRPKVQTSPYIRVHPPNGTRVLPTHDENKSQ